MENTISWFEIPTIEFERAKRFYSTIFEFEMDVSEMMGIQMGFFPYRERHQSGAIVFHEGMKPSMDGVLIFFHGGDDLNTVLERIEPAGGKVLQTKMKINDEVGYIAIFSDTEGNRLALHSRN